MEELLNNYGLHDIIFFMFFMGILFNMIQDVILSLIDYLKEKAWLVRRYESLFYEFQETFTKICYLNDDGKELYYTAINNHKERLQRIEKREKILNKLKRKK